MHAKRAAWTKEKKHNVPTTNHLEKAKEEERQGAGGLEGRRGGHPAVRLGELFAPASRREHGEWHEEVDGLHARGAEPAVHHEEERKVLDLHTGER